MRILVTGTSGRIGSALAATLSVKHKVIGVDLVSGLHTSHVMDLLSSGIKALAKDVDAVIHCAASHAKHLGHHSEQEFWDNNVETTRLLLAHSPINSPFILTSSTSVFGDAMHATGKTVWVDETLKSQPRDIYDVTKLAAEQLLSEACQEGRAGTALRMSRCFPEPEPLMALYRLYRGVDIRDVVQAHLLALSRKSGFEMLVISGPSKFQVSDTAQLSTDAGSCIKRYYPVAVSEITKRNWPLPSSIDRVYSSVRAQRVIGYKPRYGLDEFLAGDHEPQSEKHSGYSKII